MEKIIDKQNVRLFAYVNDGVCKLPIKGIVVDFFGLDNVSTFDNDTVAGEYYGERGIVYVTPYTNPWSWMNKQSVGLVDDIIDAVIDKLGLDNDIPIVLSGESMGGQSALTYCVYAKRTPIACVVNCPVCNVVYHYTERHDLPRTMFSAVYNEQCSLEDALKSISPIHLIDKMPKIEYHIFHCLNDKAVNPSTHSAVFVDRMKKSGHSITYDTVPSRGHCDLGYHAKKLYAQYIEQAIKNHK